MSVGLEVCFHKGALLFSGEIAADVLLESELETYQEEHRTASLAKQYRKFILHCANHKISIVDRARSYDALNLALTKPIKDFDHQKQALQNWLIAQGQGVVVMPTGAGKTILALMAMVKIQRSTLVVVPTIDLMHQWRAVIKEFLGQESGILGSGQNELCPITVATYDSAAINMHDIGAKFGLLICDECHHLPTPQYGLLAEQSLAPFRLGLTATVERSDGAEEKIYDLLGPKVYEVSIDQLGSDVLAPYKIITRKVKLSTEEKELYEKHRAVYLKFINQHHINLSGPSGWSRFLAKASYLPGGSEALKAHRLQKKIAQAAKSKLDEVWDIILQHPHERIIIFTDDNDLAYALGKHLILPVITHQTKGKERQGFLQAFRDGQLNILVSSRVLNEGIDVPEANIGVIVSGSRSTREHIQRLGRILRARPGKTATLYEVVSRHTSEQRTNLKR